MGITLEKKKEIYDQARKPIVVFGSPKVGIEARILKVGDKLSVSANWVDSDTTQTLTIGKYDPDTQWNEVTNDIQRKFFGKYNCRYEMESVDFYYEIIYDITDFIEYIENREVADNNKYLKIGIYFVFESDLLKVDTLLQDDDFKEFLAKKYEEEALHEFKMFCEYEPDYYHK